MNLKPTVFAALAVILLLICGFTAVADVSPLSVGSHLFKLGNYDAAITEYKRFLFIHPDDPRAGKIYRNIGLAYREQGFWHEALAAMRTATQHASDRDEKSEYQLELAVILIAMQKYDLGRLETIKVAMRTPSPSLYRRALFLQAVAYIYQFRWTEAREVLRDYTSDEKLDTLLEEAVNLPQKSPRLAKVLSAILPGAGQVYAGNRRSGLNALLLNAVLGFLTVDAVLDGHYVDALSWSGAIFLRYYRGNIFRAEEAVKRVNLMQSRRASEAVLQRLRQVAEIQ